MLYYLFCFISSGSTTSLHFNNFLRFQILSVVLVTTLIVFPNCDALFFGRRRSKGNAHYGPPKPHYGTSMPKPVYIASPPSYTAPSKPSYEPASVESNEIDDGYGSPAAPVVSSKPIASYHEPKPMKSTYHPPPKSMPVYKMPMMKYRMPSYKLPKLSMHMFKRMPMYKFPQMRLPKFMMRMPRFPRIRMPVYMRHKPMRPIYGKPIQHYKPMPETHGHGSYKHGMDLEYSGWKPIGLSYPAPEEPSYNAIDESPIITIEDSHPRRCPHPLPRPSNGQLKVKTDFPHPSTPK